MNLLILDSGHNEYVQGKKAPDSSLFEWQFNNDMQYKIKKRAEDHGIKVCLTNPEPSKKDEIGLSARTSIANSLYKQNNKPNTLFISLHANAYGSVFNTARGTETFIASNASQNSKNAAQLINNSIYDTFKSIDSGAKNRGVKTEDFTVIYKTITPAILIEYGFYSNGADLNILKNNRDELVEATVKGICKYFSVTYKAPVTIKNGWVKFTDGWSYYINDVWQKGWILDNNKWYYLNDVGYMVTGWLKENDKWYYLNSDGSMATGWIKVNNKDYYLHENGVMENKHIDLNGKCYHFEESGELVKTTDL